MRLADLNQEVDSRDKVMHIGMSDYFVIFVEKPVGGLAKLPTEAEEDAKETSSCTSKQVEWI